MDRDMSPVNDDPEMDHIMSIPAEIRGKIYNMISQNEILQCRFVCQSWREEIDALYPFDFVIDDKDKRIKWKRILQLYIHSVEIRQFLDPPLHGLGTKMFRFPTLIQVLKMTSNSFILKDNFYYLLSDCSSSLKVLVLYLENEMTFNELPTSCAELNLDNLEYLEISLETKSQASAEQENILWKREPTMFLQLLKNPMRKLKNLKLELKLLSSSQVSKCTSEVLRCLGSHSSTLKGFDYELIQGRHGFVSEEIQPLNDSYAHSMDTQYLKRIKSLKSLRIVISSSVGVNYWTYLLCQQTELRFLETDILQLPICVYKEIVQKNSRNLQIVEFTDLKIWSSDGDVTPFDLSIFQACSCLYKIILDRYVSMTTYRRRHHCAELVNLHLLPISITQISLNYFNVLSEELLLLCASNGKELGSVILTQCGNSGNFGVTGRILQEIVSLKSIVFVEISTMNYDNEGERDQLNYISGLFGYHADNGYFKMSRCLLDA